MHRPAVILGLIALLAFAGSAASASGGRTAVGTTFTADADAYVTAAAPKRNFGKARILRASARPATKSYVHFTVAGIDAPVTSATLRVYARSKTKGFAVRSTASSWSERAIKFSNAPRAGAVVGRAKRVRARRWVSINVTRAVKGNGAVSFALTGAATLASRESGSKRPQLIVTATPPTLLAAGDIAYCGQPYDEATANVIKNTPGTVAALGDLVYESGSAAEFASCYQPSWGAFKARTRPAPGNHEYETAGASGYFGYWGARAGNSAQGWYSYDLGAWHIVSLNSNCSFVGGCFAGSPQEAWLRADLAAHPAPCTLAYWHHPLFSARLGTDEADMKPIWQALYDANADLVLVGHAHDYQRFAAQTADGVADPARGIREFVVGTGGNPTLHTINSVVLNVEVTNDTTWGVLKLTLRNSGYDWQFLRAAGGTFTDSGSQACH